MIPPAEARLFAAIDATWAPRAILDRDGWLIRDGAGGGKRVSAATRVDRFALIDDATEEMHRIGQDPLFMIRTGEGDLDAELAGRGFAVIDPVTVYTAEAARLAPGDPGGLKAIRVGCPLRAMADLWAEGGVGPARLAIMERVTGPKVRLLARADERPAGVAFVAASGDIAMLHALEVGEAFRRRGIGRDLVAASAAWALENGATTVALAVTKANIGANALYSGMGMTEAADYHYRIQN